MEVTKTPLHGAGTAIVPYKARELYTCGAFALLSYENASNTVLSSRILCLVLQQMGTPSQSTNIK